MGKEELIEILADWIFWTQDIDTGIKREEYLNKLIVLITQTNQIICVSGIRMTGKPTLVLQITKELITAKEADTLILKYL